MSKNDSKDDKTGSLLVGILFFIMIICLILFNYHPISYISCKSHTILHDEMECALEQERDEWGYGIAFSERYILHNRTQEKIDADIAVENNRKEEQENERIRKEQEDCYNKGRDYTYTFDIIKDYNLSCSKLAYINDHLIDSTRQVDGGYIKGHYSGLLSYGSVEGHMYSYVTEGILATGQLVKKISYHIDCENSTLGIPHITRDYFNSYYTRDETKKIEYYTESGFVMYYVERCIEG